MAQEFKLKHHPSKPLQDLLDVLNTRNIGEAPKPLDFYTEKDRATWSSTSSPYPYSQFEPYHKKTTKGVALSLKFSYISL